MKNAPLSFRALAFVVLLGAVPAFGGQVTLGESGTNGGTHGTTNTLKFTSKGGGNFSLSILSGTNGTATDTFNVNGTGCTGPCDGGFYSIVQTSGTITGAWDPTTQVFNITQSPTTNINFYYGLNAPNGQDAGWLAGNLQLVSLQQTASTKTGIFNEALVVNLMNITTVCASANGGAGGACALEPFFTNNNGVVQLTLHFSSTVNLITALSGTTLGAFISTGSVTPTLPEPGSLALLGTGLVGLGGVLNKKTKLFRRSQKG